MEKETLTPKQHLETELRKLLQDFANKTGVRVEEIKFTYELLGSGSEVRAMQFKMW